jgi:uncharacterized protein
MSVYRILSIDGGGIRGILTAALLERIEAEHSGFLSKIDLFAGTSTGGLLSLGFASGLSPTEARRLYEEWGDRVFSPTFLGRLGLFGRLFNAGYPVGPLKEALTQQFGEMTLADLKKRVLITSFILDYESSGPKPIRVWKAKFFHNFPGPGSDEEESVVDVGIRTSAAPTYFPIYQGYIDGGVVAGNPSMSALAQALHPLTGRQASVDIVLFSVGTGLNPRYLASKNGNWGLARWAPHLVNLMLEGGSGLSDYQCRQILHSRYLRLNPTLPHPVGMDAVKHIPLLKEIARKHDLTQVHAWIDQYFE